MFELPHILALLMRQDHVKRSRWSRLLPLWLSKHASFDYRIRTTAWILPVSLRSLRIKLHIERGCAVRRECQFPFLATQNWMPGLHVVSARRKILDGK